MSLTEENRPALNPEAASGAQAKEAPLSAAEKFSCTLDLRAAKIINAEAHPKANRLYIITLETGSNQDGTPETRVIVSGLVGHYTKEELIGKQIIVAYNLKPAKLRGVESRGMLLAASDMEGPPDAEGKKTERVEVLDSSSVPPGTKVCIEPGVPASPPAQIDIDAFFGVPLEVKDGKILCGGKALTLDGRVISTSIIANGEVH